MFYVLKRGHVINKITTNDIVYDFFHSERSDDYPFARKEEVADVFMARLLQNQEITEKLNTELTPTEIIKEMKRNTLTKIIYQYKRSIFPDDHSPAINLVYITVFRFTPDYQFVKINKTCKKI